MASVLETYLAKVDSGELSKDREQLTAAQSLDALSSKIVSATRRRWSLRRSDPPPPGMYLWGGVGRGKSMLMDMFVDTLELDSKRRVHFHEFMQEVHNGMNAARAAGKNDALAPVADQLVAELKVLALDEMQITDIADAMIVGRLFSRLLDGGVTVVTTSNRHPGELYKNGLNRKLFEPFIDLIEDRLTVLELDSDQDYRQNKLAGTQVYFAPNDQSAKDEVASIWDDLTNGHGSPLDLAVKGRMVTLPAFHNGAGRVRFADLCERPLGAADYLAVASAVRVLVLEDIPLLGPENFDAAKRFVTLIDALYEAGVRLIVTAAAQPEDLYNKGTGAFEFERTASRLREMQGADWGSAS